MKKYTTINHEAQKALGLTLTEYCLADLIYHLGSNPKNKLDGWCYASRTTLGEMLDISKRGVLNMLEKLEGLGVIEKDPDTKNVRITTFWYETAITTGEKNAPPVNKVHRRGEQSAPPTGEQSAPNLKNPSIKGSDLTKKEQDEWIVGYFEETLKLTMPQRYLQLKYARQLINQFGIHDVKGRIDAAAVIRGKEFAPKILDLKQLWFKWNDLQDFYQRHQPKHIVSV
jgi:DNA-binding MarR family transcriptional regulator